MNRTLQILCAAVGVFVGSLLADTWFGDGIQTDDIGRAMMVASIAGILQFWLTRKKPQ